MHLDLTEVRAAADRLAGHAHRTPTFTCSTLDRLAGKRLYFKAEHLQKVGAFKIRGAANAILKLPAALARQGVVTHSSGNHAQAVALAARWRGIAAHLVMPTNASPIKRQAVQAYGGQVVDCEPTVAAREAAAASIQAQTGAIFIPPYNHPDVIAGQGTVGLELLDQVSELQAIIAPIGGGGLISGLCVAAKSLKPSILIFGAEPAGADDAARSKQAGQLIPQMQPMTIADGLRTSLDDLTWPIIRDQVERIICVSEEQIIAAMRLTWERTKQLIEPSSAVAVAAVLTAEFKALPEIQHVGVVISGGNVDLDQLAWVTSVS